MLHAWIIALFVPVLVHDSLGIGVEPGGGRLHPMLVGWPSAAICMVPMLLLMAVVHLVSRAVGAEMDQRGEGRAVALMDRALTATRIGAAILSAVNILAFGWLDTVRSVVGDLVIVDELLAISPALLVYLAGTWSMYPVERRLREAAVMRALDTGRTIYPMPSRGQFVLDHARHQVALSLLPISIILGWGEALDMGIDWLVRQVNFLPGEAPHHLPRLVHRLAVLLSDPEVQQLAHFAGQILGILVVLSFGPPLLRLIWNTTRLGPGPVRERLVAMCKQNRVRVRELLIWRTHGTTVNGAVMGLLGWFRYILLTDALLDSLPEDQVEAVTAHEIAHVRCGHLVWLALVLIATIGTAGLVASLIAYGAERLLGLVLPAEPGEAAATAVAASGVAIELLMTVAILAAAMVAFGWVSRRFEWQADAFAARQMSLLQAPAATSITPEAANTMVGALEAVARLNFVPRRKWGWRHGSIAYRQERLKGLVGLPVGGLPIDRTARRIKWAAAAALAVVVGASVLAWVYEPGESGSGPSGGARSSAP